jgi:hypothetical protein
VIFHLTILVWKDEEKLLDWGKLILPIWHKSEFKLISIFIFFSVSNEKNLGPKFPKNRNKIEVSVSSKNFGENRNFLFISILMLKFINFHLLFHSKQTVMTRKLLYFAWNCANTAKIIKIRWKNSDLFTFKVRLFLRNTRHCLH